MASKPIVPLQQQPRGDAVVGGGKPLKKNGAAGEGRNRRALLDIGNVVTLKGVDVKPNRPVTRSFCAQLLANAQAAAVNENNKKQVCANVPPTAVDGVAAVAKRVAPKPAVQKKVIAKPKPVEVIQISDEKENEDKAVHKKKEADVNNSKKKPSRTLTSVLTARSKAACGLANKPKEIVDIDAGDANNELAAVEYLEDIYKFYKMIENESRPHDYMDSQPEINERMRAILIDWLVDVHTKFDLSPETLYLTINIVDRFLAVKLVPRKELQLVGISAMLMASKYEEIWPPEVNDFVTLSDYAYTHEQILVMEKTILGKLEWTLTVPTPFVFLIRFIKAASVPGVLSDQEPLENMAHFLSELGMMHYATLMYCPSMVAAAAVFAARCTLNKSPVWNETLKMHTGYSEEQLMDCAKLLTSFHSNVGNGKLKVLYRKYSDPQKGAVAVLPPAKNLLPADVGSV
ncbi:G2/mitotic-specific cyclin S13-7 [Trifolium repens]|nr:G2/mitotic-specific cyclin S13-7 [Trifolium repens]